MQALYYGKEEQRYGVVVEALRTRGHDVRYVDRAEGVWTACEDTCPPLVMLAWEDPESPSLCRRLRREAAQEGVTIVVVLQDADNAPLMAAVQAGADDYLLASLDVQRLEARLVFIERNAEEKRQRVQAEGELARRARQQAVVAALGQRALAAMDVQQLMDYAAEATAEALHVPFAEVLEHRPDEACLVLRAAYGGPPERVGRVSVAAGEHTLAGFTLTAPEPVVVGNGTGAARFDGGAVVAEQEVASSATVAILGEDEPYGVLGVHATTARAFSEQDVNFLQAVANVLAEAIDRRRAEDALRESEARNRAIVETTVDAIITIDKDARIETFNSAAESIFGYRAPEVVGRNVKVLMPSPYREEHDGYMRSYAETGRRKIIGIGREVTGRRKDGTTFPMDLAVSEVELDGRTLFTGIIRDITERRRLEQEILQISDEERRRIGQDLHDGLGQMLTGIGLITQNLARKLKANAMPGADEVTEVTELIREADEFARALAKGLVPVELEANGLAAALQRLAENAERLFDIQCTFEDVGQALIHDSAAALHLYRIAQEAVSNGVKHGRANHVTIRLASGEEHVRLQVHDDGVGFPEVPRKEQGMGVRIMQYRARIIGGRLEIWRDPAGGTAVTCTLRRTEEPIEHNHTTGDPTP